MCNGDDRSPVTRYHHNSQLEGGHSIMHGYGSKDPDTSLYIVSILDLGGTHSRSRRWPVTDSSEDFFLSLSQHLRGSLSQYFALD